VSSAPTSRRSEADPKELVACLCHEVGNLLAAARLSGHVLSYDPSPTQVANTGTAVEALAAQSGALVGLFGPLLGVSKLRRDRLSPEDLLAALPRALPDALVERVSCDCSASELPDVSLNAHVISALLLAWVFSACEASPKEAPVRVTLSPGGEGVALRIEDRAPPLAGEEDEGPLRGRPLLLAVAEALLEAIGGAVEVGKDVERGNAVTLHLPLA